MLRTCAIVLFTYVFFRFLFRFISPFLFGWILSILFQPLVDFMEVRWKWKRAYATMFAIFLMLAFCSIVVAGCIYRLISEFTQFYSKLPIYLESLQLIISQITEKLDQAMAILPDSIQSVIVTSNENLLQFITNVITMIVQNSETGAKTFQFVLGIPQAFLVAFLTIFSAYFFSRDKKEIGQFVSRNMPSSWISTGVKLKSNLWSAFVGYMKAQLIIMIYVFFICYIGMAIFRSPYAFLLAVSTSVIDALPIFGSGFILWPAALVQFLLGNPGLALGYLAIYACVQFMRQILQPKVLGQQIGLHPLVTLAAMFIGLKIFGVMGMILGPILAVLMIQAEKALYED